MLIHGNDTHTYDLESENGSRVKEIFEKLELYPLDFTWATKDHTLMWVDYADNRESLRFSPKVVIYDSRRIKLVDDEHFAKDGLYVLEEGVNSFKDALLAFVTLRVKGKDGKWVQKFY